MFRYGLEFDHGRLPVPFRWLEQLEPDVVYLQDPKRLMRSAASIMRSFSETRVAYATGFHGYRIRR